MRSIYLTGLGLVIACSMQAQFFTKIIVKGGHDLSGQIVQPARFDHGTPTFGLSIGVEPTILTFGKNKQFDLNADFGLTTKGSKLQTNTYSYYPDGTIAGVGTETYTLRLLYFSIAPTLKMNFGKIFYVKAGPRMDALVGVYNNAYTNQFPQKRSDLQPVIFGANYGAGFCLGKKRTTFICEFVGQQDFTDAAYISPSHISYRNYAFIVNVGASIALGKPKE